MHPLVSVLIDSYNHASFIEAAIDSALAQDYPKDHLEVIVVDDGSTDDTAQRCAKYGSAIRYIRKDNGGQSSAFNLGFSIARGEYLLLLDADDYLLPERAKVVVAEFERYPNLSAVFNRRRVIGENLDVVDSFGEYHDISLSAEHMSKLWDISFGTSRMAIRSSALAAVLPLPETSRIGADIYLISLILVGSFSSLPDVLTVYRVHGNNLFHNYCADQLPLQHSCLVENLGAIRTLAAARFPQVDAQLLERYLLPFTLMQEDFALQMRINDGTATRADVAKVEGLKLQRYYPTWSVRRSAKLLRSSFLLMLPPKLSAEAQRIWAKIRQTR